MKNYREKWRIKLKNLSKKELDVVLENEVYCDPDFKRHIKETATKENIPEIVVETVIKKYIKDIGLEMIKIKKKRRRIVLFGFLNIDIIEPIYNEYSIYYKYFKNKNYESKQQ